ncbi:DUF3634 family protein [Vibrio sp. SCSIO 43136]|uniref:DUF3634 family protein n=1 Tax=Vibrio sp. SCSIO 43136 TaxID=2819101 RepID=UPI00207502CE|nr:DUF3634 family protein [Vibrio sp. SCSIO 43136]USD66539.1 DUF3634 family protein [Vibrio sp. SCSIO 43136]
MLWVLLVAIVVVIWLVGVDRPVLKVTFEEGKITSFKGHFPPAFKHNCHDIGQRSSVTGEFKVYNTRNGAKLKFSKAIPNSVQQRIRNVFPHQGFKNDKSKRRA